MDSVTVRFTYTEAEQVRAAQLYYCAVMRLRVDAVVVAALCSIGLYLFLSGRDATAGTVLMAIGGLVVGLMTYVYFIRPRQLYRSDPTLRNVYDLVFNDAEIHFQTANIDSRLNWGIYQSVLRDRDLIVLRHGKRTMTVLPIRAFASADDLHAFERMMERHISGVNAN